jgi:hypothetical protein
MKKSDLLGTWKLLSFEIRLENNQTILPYGSQPVGYLIYGDDDLVSVHFMPSNRIMCASDDYRDTSIEEKMEMANNYGGYVGKFEILNDAIVHYPDVCVFPNFINVPQVRKYEYFGDQLILKCSYFSKEHAANGTSYITWVKNKT